MFKISQFFQFPNFCPKNGIKTFSTYIFRSGSEVSVNVTIDLYAIWLLFEAKIKSILHCGTELKVIYKTHFSTIFTATL